MKQKRFKEEQIIGALKEVDAGAKVDEVCRRLGISHVTFYRWRAKPDAILEVPGRRRRLFIEAETGTQSIATANPGQTGAVLSKLRRYGQFLCGFAGLHRHDTWYSCAFPDGFAPRLVFFVHSAGRKRRVEKALQEALGRSETSFKVFVLTFEAAATLARYVTDGRLRAPAARGAMHVVTMDAQKASQLRDGYNQLAGRGCPRRPNIRFVHDGV